jgi:hypothetical protein
MLLDMQSEVAELNWTCWFIEGDGVASFWMSDSRTAKLSDRKIVAVPDAHVHKVNVTSYRPLLKTEIPHGILHHNEDGIALHVNAFGRMAKLVHHLDDDPGTSPVADEPVDNIHTLQPVWEICNDLSCGQITSRKLYIPTRATVAEAIVDATSSHYIINREKAISSQMYYVRIVFLYCGRGVEALLQSYAMLVERNIALRSGDGCARSGFPRINWL